MTRADAPVIEPPEPESANMFVIDALSLAIDYGDEARESSELAQAMADKDLDTVSSLAPDEYMLPRDQYQQTFSLDALVSALFLESPIEMTCFHSARLYGRDYSPMSIGQALRDRHPDRTLLYGFFETGAGASAMIDDLERQVEIGVDGMGLRPWDMVDGVAREVAMNDEDLVYPALQRCVDRGVKVIAVHKGLPEGVAPTRPYRLGDLDYAARDFPMLQFEVVHAGFSMLEESALLLERFPNVWINLEASVLYAMRRRGKYADILGEFLRAGGEDRLMFGSGVPSCHPRPIIEALAGFTMPERMLRRGYPQVTDEITAKVLGRNFARLHGIDVTERRTRLAADPIGRYRSEHGLRAPWSAGVAG